MIIALDWDKTITADPGLFKILYDAAKERGHTVIIVTGRQAHDQIVPPWPIDVVYAGDQWKHDAALAAGYRVDIWVDDCPGVIMPAQKLIW